MQYTIWNYSPIGGDQLVSFSFSVDYIYLSGLAYLK